MTEGKIGFGKASDRVKAKKHRPSGIPVGVLWGAVTGALSLEGRELDRSS